jgi:hypothetical protein
MKAYRERGGVTPLILNLSNIWKWVVSLMLQLLYHQERNPSTH